MLLGEVLIGELLTVDGLTASTLIRNQKSAMKFATGYAVSAFDSHENHIRWIKWR
jgi:hypothetical protein